MSERMGKCSQFLISLLMVVLLQGCVSTTSGPPQSEPDENEAADLLYQLGARYYRNGEYELARERLLMSIEKNPNNPIAYSTLALTYEQLDNVRLATEAYEEAVKIAPKNFAVLNTYAVFLCRYGEYDEAQKYFERAINIRETIQAKKTRHDGNVLVNALVQMHGNDAARDKRTSHKVKQLKRFQPSPPSSSKRVPAKAHKRSRRAKY